MIEGSRYFEPWWLGRLTVKSLLERPCLCGFRGKEGRLRGWRQLGLLGERRVGR